MAVGVAEAFRLPSGGPHPVPDGVLQNRALRQPGQVQILRVVVPELIDPHVRSPPQRDEVDVEAQPGAGVGRDQRLLALEPLRHPLGQRPRARHPDGVPADRPGGVVPRLVRGQHPLVGLGHPLVHCLVGLLELGRDLADLEVVEVERVAVGVDGLPGQPLADGGPQVLEAGLVGGQEHQHVAAPPGPGPPLVQEPAGEFERLAAVGLGVVGGGRVEHHQPGRALVGHVAGGAGAGVNRGEEGGPGAGPVQAGPDGLVHVGVGEVRLGPVLGQPGDGGLQRVPVAGPVPVEVHGLVRQLPQGVAEGGRRLAGLHAPELDGPVVEPLVGRLLRRRRAEVDGAGDPPGRRVAPQVGVGLVQLEGQRLGAVDVGLDHRPPAVVEVADQLGGHVVVVDGDGGGHDQQARVAAHPQRVDDLGHEPQHPAGALEPLQLGPVPEEPVEQLGVDWVGGLHAPLVVALPAPRRELVALGLGPVEVAERLHHRVPLPGRAAVEPAEEPAADDLEALLGAGRAPVGLHAGEQVLELGERHLAALAAHLDVRRRDGGHQQGLGGVAGRVGEGLGEAEVGVERAGGQAGHPVELAGVGHPFVDEDQARRASPQQPGEGLSGVGPGPV